MIIGVPKEIKNHEYRVGLVPDIVYELVQAGHPVFVERDAGAAIGFTDEHYALAGAHIVDHARVIFDEAQLIVKVKEPQVEECARLKSHQTLFTYLHLAPDFEQTRALLASKAKCIAYETVSDDAGRLPLLAPMSEVAGRMAVQAAAHQLEKSQGGRGVLLGGVSGVPSAKLVIIGAGVVGTNALQMAVGLGAQVTILDTSLERLRYLDALYGNRIQTLYSSQANLQRAVLMADVVIGGVLIPGAKAPKLVSEQLVKEMKAGSVLVDVAIDQGGCFETSRPTTHSEPAYRMHDVIHYCVANMPGAVARTSTLALNHATAPFIHQLANLGIDHALQVNRHLMNGLNVYQGFVTCKAVAEAQGCEYVSPGQLLH